MNVPKIMSELEAQETASVGEDEFKGDWKQYIPAKLFMERMNITWTVFNRWVKKHGLPVVKIGPGRNAPVFLYEPHVNAWLLEQGNTRKR